MTSLDLMTEAEAIAYLRLDADGKDANEAIRNLRRRHQLPCKQRAGRRWYRQSEIDAWLERGHRGYRSRSKATAPT